MASITINFSNATLSSSNTSVLLSDGTYGLDISEGFTLSGTVTFTELDVSTTAISFNVAPGTTFNGYIEVNVASTNSGTPPEIEITNFTGTVNVSWPTNRGKANQNVESGNPLTLSGYTG